MDIQNNGDNKSCFGHGEINQFLMFDQPHNVATIRLMNGIPKMMVIIK